jgi:hypothetical protein
MKLDSFRDDSSSLSPTPNDGSIKTYGTMHHQVHIQNPARRMQHPSNISHFVDNVARLLPPPLPPSRRRANSSGEGSLGDYSFQRSRSAEYEGLNPLSAEFHGYNNKTTPRQDRHTLNGPTYDANDSVIYSTNNLHPRLSISSEKCTPPSNHSRPKRRIPRESSFNSLVSLNSQGSSPRSKAEAETMKLLPDPRWGGGGGGKINRTRTTSSGSNGSSHVRTSSFLGGDALVAQHYATVSSSRGHHNRYPSESSHNSFALSVMSTDQSVEPLITDMTKSAMYKDVTSEGIVRLQLPKDNFRLLSDPELGKRV